MHSIVEVDVGEGGADLAHFSETDDDDEREFIHDNGSRGCD